jgi:hypothetical protein
MRQWYFGHLVVARSRCRFGIGGDGNGAIGVGLDVVCLLANGSCLDISSCLPSRAYYPRNGAKSRTFPRKFRTTILLSRVGLVNAASVEPHVLNGRRFGGSNTLTYRFPLPVRCNLKP